MFGRYFAPRYFARRYFGGSAVAEPEPLVPDPKLTLAGRHPRVRTLSVNRVRALSSRWPRKRKL